jgi:hypothetical protein
MPIPQRCEVSCNKSLMEGAVLMRLSTFSSSSQTQSYLISTLVDSLRDQILDQDAQCYVAMANGFNLCSATSI